ncbi:MAG: sulfite oxidase heme-binding subunit YedZ [Chloroflexota bacterium]
MSRSFSRLQIAVHLVAWLPVVYLFWANATGNLTVNPIQAATQRTGYVALVFLMLSLLCTPLNTLFKWKQAHKLRRTLGLYAFFYAALHLLIFAGVDYRFNLEFVLADTGKKPFVWVGLTTFLILLALALTSFPWAMKRLGKNWKRLHRLVYLAAVLDVVHYAWAKKANLFTLSGDVWQPLLFMLFVALLLVFRIPALRRRLAA